MQIPATTAAETSIATTQKHLPFQMKPICILCFFLLCLALLLFIFDDGEMEGIWELLR